MVTHRSLRREKELLGKIQENLAVARQAAQHLIARYKTPLSGFIKNHLNQVGVEKIAKKTFINAFNEIVSGQLPDDFFQRLLVIAEESARKTGDPRPMVLPPLNISTSGLAIDICDKALLSEITQRIRDIRTSIDELLGMYRSDLFERVKPYVNYDVHDADDVVQNTHIRAYRKIYTLFYDEYGNPKASVDHHFLSWLHTIALRVIADGLRKKRGPGADYPEDEEGEEFEPPDLKINVSRQAILRILIPEVLHQVVSENEPHKVFVFVFKELIGWKPTDIVEKFSDFTLEELFAQFREHCMCLPGWSPETVAWVLSPLSNKLSQQDKQSKAQGKKRLGDYFGKDPENDIQMWRRSVVQRTRAHVEKHPEITALVNLLKGL